VVTFARNVRTGALTPLGCIQDNHTGTDSCAQSTSGLDGARSIALTNASLYVAGRDGDTVAIFSRNPRTGRLTPRGCINDNDTGTGNCAQSTDGLDTPRSLDISADRRWLYVASTDDSALVRFRRNLRTGALFPAGCIDDYGGPDACAQSVPGLAGPYYVELSEDGRTGYVASLVGDSLAMFSRTSLSHEGKRHRKG
jgi:hypothetical protein